MASLLIPFTSLPRFVASARSWKGFQLAEVFNSLDALATQ
jgi:hypothetical protein